MRVMKPADWPTTADQAFTADEIRVACDSPHYPEQLTALLVKLQAIHERFEGQIEPVDMTIDRDGEHVVFHATSERPTALFELETAVANIEFDLFDQGHNMLEIDATIKWNRPVTVEA